MWRLPACASTAANGGPKMAPRKYGDRLDLNHSGSLQQLSDEQLDARLAELLRKAAGEGGDAS